MATIQGNAKLILQPATGFSAEPPSHQRLSIPNRLHRLATTPNQALAAQAASHPWNSSTTTPAPAGATSSLATSTQQAPPTSSISAIHRVHPRSLCRRTQSHRALTNLPQPQAYSPVRRHKTLAYPRRHTHQNRTAGKARIHSTLPQQSTKLTASKPPSNKQSAYTRSGKFNAQSIQQPPVTG